MHGVVAGGCVLLITARIRVRWVGGSWEPARLGAGVGYSYLGGKLRLVTQCACIAFVGSRALAVVCFTSGH